MQLGLKVLITDHKTTKIRNRKQTYSNSRWSISRNLYNNKCYNKMLK